MSQTNGATCNGTQIRNQSEIRVQAGSRKAMLVWLSLELWKRNRLDMKRLIEARGEQIRSQKQALKVLTRSSTADLEQAILSSLNGNTIEVEGRVEILGNPERELLSRLGVELPSDAPIEDEPEPVRFIDMTPVLLGFAAIIMALRYLALGLSDRELYVMAGIGYAAFILIRTFSYKLKRPKNAPPPEEISRQPSAVR